MPWTATVIQYDSSLLSDNILLVSKALISEIGFVHLLNVMQILQRAEFSESEYANKLCFSSRFIFLRDCLLPNAVYGYLLFSFIE